MLIGPLSDAILSLAAAIPIATLLGGLTMLSWSARRAAIVAFGAALALGLTLFGLTLPGLLVALAKGVLLSLFVLFVMWAALVLFTLVVRLGAADATAAAMVNATGEPAVRALMMGWGFSGFLQGIAGFGAPVASVVPLLRLAGFAAVPSIAAAMVGHSWAITFGSMGSSYYAILLVTRVPAEEATPWIATLFTLPIVLTGFAALHILLGWTGVREGAPIVVAVGGAMAVAMLLIAEIGAAPVASVIPGMLGCGLLWLIGRRVPALVQIRSDTVSVTLAFFPYLLLIVLTLVTQFGPLGSVARGLVLGIDLPGTVTALGYQVLPEASYPRLRVLQHPAVLIGVAIAGMMVVYRRHERWADGVLLEAVYATYHGSSVSSAAVIFMVLMALVMADAGMTSALAAGIRTVAGPAYPLVAPLLGVLGALVTGSNTSSNVTMGALQVETAAALVLAPALIAAAQTVGGALGAGVSPDKAVIGASVGGAVGQEATIMRRALPYGVAIAVVVGIEVLILARLYLP